MKGRPINIQQTTGMDGKPIYPDRCQEYPNSIKFEMRPYPGFQFRVDNNGILHHERAGWIAWKGGRCPVPLLTKVDVRFENGAETHGLSADNWIWSKRKYAPNIIAYKIHELNTENNLERR